jgi:hypothetical protein
VKTFTTATAASALLALGCSTQASGVGRVDSGAAAATQMIEAGGCVAVIESHPNEGAAHIPCAGPAIYQTAPPSSGNHYPKWPDYHTYDLPVPWGNLVHALEHGAVVIGYNCPQGCADEVARAQALIDRLPADPLCAPPDLRRVILAPDPTLPAELRWAASAWTWTMRAPCFDELPLQTFIDDHYGQGSEATCAELHAPLCP